MTNSINVDTFYDAYFNRRKTSNLGDYLTDAIDLEILIKIWLKTVCKGKFEYVIKDSKQYICFDSVDDYTKFCLTWC